jgi:Protein of unknown function (DUF4230)
MAMRSIKSGVKALVFGGGVTIALLLVLGVIGPGLFNVSSPFSTSTVDHSPPIVLTEISDLAEFRAAEAEFRVIVDQEKDVKYVPDFVAGERTQYVAVGSIDAVVDFSGLTDDSITYDAVSGKAVVVLPVPTLGDPVIDFENSGVMNRDRGVIDRVGGVFSDSPTGEEDLIVAAQTQMVDAVPSSDLLERAEANTEKMLTTLLTGVGVREVDVVFEAPSTS